MEPTPEEYEGDDYEGGVVKKFMYVNRRAPHGTVYAQESLEVVLIGAAFDQDVSVVFLDDGVYQIPQGSGHGRHRDQEFLEDLPRAGDV